MTKNATKRANLTHSAKASKNISKAVLYGSLKKQTKEYTDEQYTIYINNRLNEIKRNYGYNSTIAGLKDSLTRMVAIPSIDMKDSRGTKIKVPLDIAPVMEFYDNIAYDQAIESDSVQRD